MKGDAEQTKWLVWHEQSEADVEANSVVENTTLFGQQVVISIRLDEMYFYKQELSTTLILVDLHGFAANCRFHGVMDTSFRIGTFLSQFIPNSGSADLLKQNHIYQIMQNDSQAPLQRIKTLS